MIKTRYFSCYIKGSEEEIDGILECLSAVQNVYNMSYWDAVGYMFRLGAQQSLKEVEDEYKRDKARQALLKHKLILAIRKESQKDDEIRKGMTELGIERIVSVAKAEGLNEKDVRVILEAVRADMPYTSAVAQWLEDYLSDHKAHKTDDVKDAAVEAGILPNKDDPSFDNKWATMRVIASRLGLSGSGKWGEWQKKLL